MSLEPDTDCMSDADIEHELVQLRRRFGMSDADVIALAERGELPRDVDHDFWLVLLGRGDLIREIGRA